MSVTLIVAEIEFTHTLTHTHTHTHTLIYIYIYIYINLKKNAKSVLFQNNRAIVKRLCYLKFPPTLRNSMFHDFKLISGANVTSPLAKYTDPLVRVFANGPVDRSSIPGRVIPKTQKMVLHASLLNTQHYIVRIKGKVEQSRETIIALPKTSKS